MLSRRTILRLSLLLSALLLAGCTFVQVQNISDLNATVAIRVPDSPGAYTRQVGPGNSVEVFSNYGGQYSITVVPSERYRQTLLSLRDQITQKLFEERATLTAAEVAQLIENLGRINQLVEEMAQPGASCGGNVPDFETAVAILSWDSLDSTWTLTCQ